MSSIPKFRAWDERNEVLHNNFRFINSGPTGSDWILFVSDLQPLSSNWVTNPYFFQQFHIMMFSGYSDMNNREIYQNDIVSFINAAGQYKEAICRFEEIERNVCGI